MAALKRQANDPLPITEVSGPVVSNNDIPQVTISYGIPFEEALKRHIDSMPNVSRVFLISSKSLISNTDALPRLEAALGKVLVGHRIGLRPHTMWDECLDVAEEVKSTGAQYLVALGGSSVGDAAKFIAMAALQPLETQGQIEPRILKESPNLETMTQIVKALPFASIPTTLSAGEHTPGIGLTNSTTGVKRQLFGPRPSLVIYDPHLALATPARLWLSSGVRGLDHATEALCALDTLPELDQIAGQALRLLVPGLLRCHEDLEDVQARLNCQLGVSLAIMPICRGLPLGASHAIGHMMGPMGVVHGETSCIMLPAVCRWNMPANGHKQQQAVEVLREIPEVDALMRKSRLRDDVAADAAGRDLQLTDYLDAVIRALGMPRSLKEVGVEGEEKLEDLARRTMIDFWSKTNPREIKGPDDVMEILRLAQ